MELELSGPLLTRKNRFRFARDTGFAEVESGPGPGTAPLPYAFGSRPCHCKDEYRTDQRQRFTRVFRAKLLRVAFGQELRIDFHPGITHSQE